MIRTLRAMLAMLVLCLFAGSCQILSWSFSVPDRVAAGSVFVIEVKGVTDGGLGEVAAVLQLPNGYQVLGATAWSYGTSLQLPPQLATYLNGGTRDDPHLLANYTAEPGHYLVSFHDIGTLSAPVSFEITLKLYLRAPNVPGIDQCKLALGNFEFAALPVYYPQYPAGTTDFAAITSTANVRTLQVMAAPPLPPFTPAATELWDTVVPASGFAIGDLDGDGRDDLIEREATGPRAHLSRPSGWIDITGNLSSAASSGTWIADFDGDGFGDVLFGSSAVVFGSGGPQWTPGPTLPVGAGGRQSAIGDVDGDGRQDIVVTSDAGVQVFRANADRTFTPFGSGLPTSASGVIAAVADLDGDRCAEIVLLSPSAQVRLWRGDGQGNWAFIGTVPFPVFPQPYVQPVILIDVDGNGQPEIAGSGSPLAYRLVGSALVPIPMQAIEFGAGVALDHDRDGRSDLLLTRSSPVGSPSGYLQLLRNMGGGVFQDVVLPVAAGFGNRLETKQLRTGDIDGDSFPDVAALLPEGPLVWRNTSTGAASYGAACGGPGFAAPQMSVSGTVATGQSVTLQLTGALPNGPAFLWAGLSKRTWAGLPLLPLGLDFLGAPDCVLLAEPSVVVPKVADGTGFVTHVMSLPVLLPTDTLTFFLQGAVFAPGANGFQFLFSQGLALKMQ